MLHHRANTTVAPSHFTGKEKDPLRLYLQSGELCRARLTSPPDWLTGYSYFAHLVRGAYHGARYLEHEMMTGWLSVDPMADKYPSISPYAYCAWNPVKLVDPEGNDWYEYTDKKTKKTEIRWTNCHNQDELDKINPNGIYLGVTAEDGTTYYGLMADIVNKASESERYRMVKNIDQAIIYRAKSKTHFSSEEVDFSNVFKAERGWKSDNERIYSYAGGVVSIATNGTNMLGRFDENTKLEGRGMSGPMSHISLEPPRYNITGRLCHGAPIAGISFAHNPLKQADFDRIYNGLKGRVLTHATKLANGWNQTKY